MGILILVFPLAYVLLSKIGDQELPSIFKAISKLLIFVSVVALPFWVFAQLTNISTSTSVWGKIFSPQASGLNTYEYIVNPLVDPVVFFNRIFGDLVGNRKLFFLHRYSAIVFSKFQRPL